MVKQIVKQELLQAPWKTIPGEKMDYLDKTIPQRHTMHLNIKSNKHTEPLVKGIKCNAIKCEFCKSKMEWDKDAGYFFCTGCVYAVGTNDLKKERSWRTKK